MGCCTSGCWRSCEGEESGKRRRCLCASLVARWVVAGDRGWYRAGSGGIGRDHVRSLVRRVRSGPGCEAGDGEAAGDGLCGKRRATLQAGGDGRRAMQRATDCCAARRARRAGSGIGTIRVEMVMRFGGPVGIFELGGAPRRPPNPPAAAMPHSAPLTSPLLAARRPTLTRPAHTPQIPPPPRHVTSEPSLAFRPIVAFNYRSRLFRLRSPLRS